MSTSSEFVLAALAMAISAIAAAHDVRDRRIPNWLTYPSLLGGVCLQFLVGDLEAAALGGVTAFAIGFCLFAVNAIGGGDVKLLCVLGVLLGQPHLLTVCVLSVMLGAIFGVFVLILNGKLARLIRELYWFLRASLYPGLNVTLPVVDEVIPFGVAIAASVSVVTFGVLP